MLVNRKRTVARFPNGSWTTGGKPDDPAYAECSVYQVIASDDKEAKRKAQYLHRKAQKAKGTP